MSIVLTADDVGFVVDTSKVNDDESVCIDGIDLPKYIPEPVFSDRSDMSFTSDRVESDDLVKALVPSKGTPSHCILFAQSHISHPEDSMLSNQISTDSYGEEMLQLTEQLANLKKVRRTSKLNDFSDITGQMNYILERIVKIQIILLTRSRESAASPGRNRLYDTEINRFIDNMIKLKESLSDPDVRQGVDEDVDVLKQLLEVYDDEPSYINAQELEKTYHELMKKYIYICLFKLVVV